MLENENSFVPSKEPKAGDIKFHNGIKYRWESHYTLRQYYSHSTEIGPGPGWDFRTELLDDGYAMKKFRRTFTNDEVFSPQNLPDIPLYDWFPVEEEMNKPLTYKPFEAKLKKLSKDSELS